MAEDKIIIPEGLKDNEGKITIPHSLKAVLGAKAGCTDWCETYCEDDDQDCSSICQTACEQHCQRTCQISCQNCEGVPCQSCECNDQGGETPTTVSCIRQVYYQNADGTYSYQNSYTETGLIPGYTYTPEALSHMPPYDSSTYVFDHCQPSGSMTCPSSDFIVKYYFNLQAVTYTITSIMYKPDGTIYSTTYYNKEAGSYQVHNFVGNFDTNLYSFNYASYNGNTYTYFQYINVTSDSTIYIYLMDRGVICTRYAYVDGEYATFEISRLTPGSSFRPKSYPPIEVSSTYELDSIIYNNHDYIDGTSLTVPNDDFYIIYYYTYVPPPPPPEKQVYIYTPSGWKGATPYIYTSSGWKQATPYIYDGSQWK